MTWATTWLGGAIVPGTLRTPAAREVDNADRFRSWADRAGWTPEEGGVEAVSGPLRYDGVSVASSNLRGRVRGWYTPDRHVG